jgi:hypothetical protein
MSTASAAESLPKGWILHAAPNPKPSGAYKWLETILEASAREVDRVGAKPTIISREMVISVTAMYDAWAAYDEKAIGTRMGAKLRRPPAERTAANKETAIAYAVHRTLLYVFPHDAAWIDGEMKKAGYDPANQSMDPSTAAGVGNLAAQAVIDYRRRDGANQHGDEVGSNGKPYSDWTQYETWNTVDKVLDPDKWQPITFVDAKGNSFAPGFLTPHWYRVKPFALERADQFRPPPPPKVTNEQLRKEVEENIRFNGALTLQEKAIVEFMRDGPRSTGQSGHWLRFAMDVSRRDHYDIDKDVKIFFAIANVAFDAFIAAWDAKRFYNSSRPWTLVRHYMKGKTLVGYAGPCKGFTTVPAEKWHPYSPASFVTPPFPGYVAGHSTVSGASAKMLELFTGSDKFGAVERRKAGALTEPECKPEVMQSLDGKAPAKVAATTDIELKLPTFTATADMAGISRVMGGYHIQADNVEGLALGRKVAQFTWPRIRAYFEGTATPEGAVAQKASAR